MNAPASGAEFAHVENEHVFRFPNLVPCHLKILIVVDGTGSPFFNISFNHSYFGLSAVLDTLRDNPEFFVRFDVTRAHRQLDLLKPDPVADPVAHERYGPHYEQFRFDQPEFVLDDFDEVWLFGMRTSEEDTLRLSDVELEILSRWMDNGGGVFATGDHEDLGASLCARVPRAGTMRKWTQMQYPPPQYGPNRHDTLHPGHDSTYTFDDESDDIPMSIEVAQYTHRAPFPFPSYSAPHPVLCGRSGVIDVLPDHPHEGEVLDVGAIDPHRKFTFGSYTADEYPGAAAARAMPEVIARARVRADHTTTTDLNKGAAIGKEFPVLGAYDGHRAGVGRVVVDSTWHHWFDVNLVGRPPDRLDTWPHNYDNPKTQGFLASSDGLVAWSKIQNFFRNVALWCAPAAQQRCLLVHATWGAIIRYPAVERLRPGLPPWQLGDIARDAIGRVSSQCMLTQWLEPLFPERFVELFDVPNGPGPVPPNPCLTCPPWRVTEIYALGGATRVLLDYLYERESAAEPAVDHDEIAELFVAGIRQGIAQLVDDLATDADEVRLKATELAAIADAVPVTTDFRGLRDHERGRD
jgi:hypothetical protein